MSFDPATETWTSRAGPGVYDHAVVALGGVIFSFGGQNAPSILAFDAAISSWTEELPMPRATQTLAAVVLGERSYLLGGHNDSAILSSVDVFGPARRLHLHRKN
jgi:hypothetical protein